MSRRNRPSFRPIAHMFSRALPLVLLFAASQARAGDWQWGCVGSMGDNQIAFNRDRLIVIAGKAPAGKLDDFARGGDFQGGVKPQSIIAAYEADDANSGLASPMTFSSDQGKSKLTLTEISSEETGHTDRLVLGCRDESIDRFRKTYRVEGGNSDANTVKLNCLEYQLSSRGGRECE